MERLAELIQDHPDTDNAIGAPGRDWMTYGDLKTLTLTVRQTLRAAGIGAQDRVAIVLPNGPEMAAGPKHPRPRHAGRNAAAHRRVRPHGATS